MINKIYNKWQQTPVIVSFADKSTPIWSIPFPAVTICAETKALKNEIDFSRSFIKYLTNETAEMTTEELHRFEAFSQICERHLLEGKQLESGLQPEDIVPLLRSIAIPSNETIFQCMWRSSHVPCSEYFSEIFTEEGLCSTFNMLDSSDIYESKK